MSAGSSAPGPGPATSLRTPKGMHDVLWPESARWEGTVARFAALVESAGYGLTITPILEHAGVFLRGIGEGSEVVGKEMYVFEDRDGQMMALRPEGTAPIARAYVQHHPVPPWKAWYVAPSFRHENPQHGRYRQHHQLGVEALGPADADLDVEVVSLAHDFFAGLGLRQVTLKLHSMGDGVCKPGYVALSERVPGRAGRSAVPGPPGPPPREPVAGAGLQVGGVPGRHRRRPAFPGPPLRPVSGTLRPGTRRSRRARGASTPSTTASCGASTTTRAPRSSSRPTRWTRPRTASEVAAATTAWSSCSAGIPRRASGSASGSSGCCWPATPRASSAPSPSWRPIRLHAYVIDTAGGESAVVLTAELRRAGLRADRAFDGRSMRSQIKSADRSGALVALVVGPQEVEAGTVGLRPLRSDAEQRSVPRAAIVEELKAFLGESGQT